jgi:predicted ATP-grasp superfamily ATP-dependent carboligase
MIGSVTINHIIEQLEMHQIAHIESQYVMPAAIFIGKRFRHAFRIYANNSGKLCANTIADWSASAGVSEIIVLGGILPANFSPPYLLERKAMLLRNELAEKSSGQSPTLGDGHGFAVPDDAIIVGLSGALLTACAARGLGCTALMIPTMSESPDPEGAAIVLEALPKIVPGLKIDTSTIRQKVEMIKAHLQEFLRMHQQQMQDYERTASRETERIYK